MNETSEDWVCDEVPKRWHTTPPSIQSNSGDDAFDLSQIFIGREQQIDHFKIYLNRWKKLLSDTPSDDVYVTSAPSPNNKIQGLVVLLYGDGGFGKSTLLRRYRDIVLQENRDMLSGKIRVSDVLDWEDTIDEDKYSLFNPLQGEKVDASGYFKVLCGQLAKVLGKNPKDFKEYSAAVRDVEKARKDANNVWDSMQKDDRYSWLRGVGIEVLTLPIRVFVPGSGVMLDNPRVRAAGDAAAKLTQEQIAQVWERLHDKLANELDDFRAPAERLGLALGRDLARFAKDFPLLIFFDTYEKADEADELLRIVIGAAGLRVGWLIAGRDNLWAGLEQRARSIAVEYRYKVEYGYKEIVPSNRGLSVMNPRFESGGLQQPERDCRPET